MSSAIKCPTCGNTVRLPESNSGQRVQCPECGEMLKAPGSMPAAAPTERKKAGAAAADDSESTWQRHRTKLIAAISSGVLLLLVTVLGIVLYVRHQNEERDRLAREKAHQEKLKEIRHIRTWEGSEQRLRETHALLGAFGEINTAGQARACLQQRLSEWKSAVGQSYLNSDCMSVVPPRLHEDPGIVCHLLDFDIVAVDSTPDAYVMTANLKVEICGEVGDAGKGRIENRQVRYKIDKELGKLLPLD